MDKLCRICKETKSIRDFYKNTKASDGYEGRCKLCARANIAAARAANIEHYRAFDRARSVEPKRRAASYARGRTYRTRQQPLKYAAYVAVSNAVRDGRLIRKPCEQCSTPKAGAHHDDYTKPLDVRWLCKLCHEQS
jgi:hypothetical protein